MLIWYYRADPEIYSERFRDGKEPRPQNINFY